jgi:hypothetical protein
MPFDTKARDRHNAEAAWLNRSPFGAAYGAVNLARREQQRRDQEAIERDEAAIPKPRPAPVFGPKP